MKIFFIDLSWRVGVSYVLFAGKKGKKNQEKNPWYHLYIHSIETSGFFENITFIR